MYKKVNGIVFSSSEGYIGCMDIKIQYNDLFPLQKALHKLYDSGMKFRMEKAVRLVQVMKDVDEQVDTVTDQLVEVIPGLKDIGYKLTPEEEIIYDGILSTQTIVDNRGIWFTDMTMQEAAMVDMQTVNTLMSFFL